MLSFIGALLSGTFMLLIKIVGIIGMGFFLSIGFFLGSLTALKAMSSLSTKTKEEGNGTRPQESIPSSSPRSN